MLFIIKYYVVKKIYQLNQERPDHNKKAFMRALAMDLSQLKREIKGDNHDEKIERIRQSVLSFFGNCQKSYDEKLFSGSLSQK